jgi:hypothetical protein
MRKETRNYRDVQRNKRLYRRARAIAGCVLAVGALWITAVVILCQGGPQ